MVAAGLEMPEMFSRLGIDGDHVAVSRRDHQHVSGRRQHTIREGSLIEREGPYGFPRLWIERFDPCVRRRLIRPARSRRPRGTAASEILPSAFDRLRRAEVLGTTFGECEIEPSGDGAI